MDWILGRVVDQSHCGTSIGNTKITDLVFTDDAVVFAESLEVQVMALKALHEEAKPLGFRVFSPKIKVPVFGDIQGQTVQSIQVCVEDNGGSGQEFLRRIGLVRGVMDTLSTSN